LEECANALGEHRHEFIMPPCKGFHKPGMLLCSIFFLRNRLRNSKLRSSPAYHQDGHFRMRQDLTRLAAEEHGRQAFTPM
jgi:hypothetical protein